MSLLLLQKMRESALCLQFESKRGESSVRAKTKSWRNPPPVFPFFLQLTSSHERTPLPAAAELISDTAVSQSVSIYTMEQENERPRKKQENGKNGTETGRISYRGKKEAQAAAAPCK